METDAFVRGLPDVESAEDLERLMSECAGVHRDFLPHTECTRELGGLRMDVTHLARCLWDARHILKNQDPKSFLHVGTGHGHSFFVISHFLWFHVSPTISVSTIDAHNYVLTDVLAFVKHHRSIASSADLVDRRYDFVFIENGEPEDYCNVGAHAKVCVYLGVDPAVDANRKTQQYGDLELMV